MVLRTVITLYTSYLKPIGISDIGLTSTETGHDIMNPVL